MKIRGVEIKPEIIMSVIPATQSVVLRSRNLELSEYAHRTVGDLMVVKCTNEKEFVEAQFEHIQCLKKKDRPENRVADHECRDEDGGFNFNKFDRLVEMRKSRAEKEKELADETELMEKMKKHNIPYYGPLNTKGT